MNKDKKAFKDWGVVKFLKDNAPNVAGEILSIAGDITGVEILNKVGDKISDSKELSKAQKQEALLMLHEEYKMYLEDVQDARKNETERDTSEYSSWLSKNIHEIIALVVVGAWIVSWWVVPPNSSAGKIIDVVLLILGYLYGRTKPQK